jgi:hypothetical protein
MDTRSLSPMTGQISCPEKQRGEGNEMLELLVVLSFFSARMGGKGSLVVDYTNPFVNH